MPRVVSWDAALEQRIAVLERAAAALSSTTPGASAAFSQAARAAVEEIGRPATTVQVAGQETRMWYDTPRGVGLVRAHGADAAWWLAAPLLAGNGVVVVDSPELLSLVDALCAVGVPGDVLRVEEAGLGGMVALAAAPDVAFVACDRGPFPALSAAIAGIAAGQEGMKALLSPLDGPQPGELGFLQRFA